MRYDWQSLKTLGRSKRGRAFLIGLPLAVLILSEAYLRFHDRLPPGRQHITLNQYVSRRFKPEFKITVVPDPDVLPELRPSHRFSTNNHGFRTPHATTLQKPTEVVRTIFIGGSTTECSLLDDTETWAFQASRLVESTSTQKVVLEDLNAGVSGTNTRDHINLLAQYLIPFQPDILVILAGINDLFLDLRQPYNALRQDPRSKVKLTDWIVGSDLLDSLYLFRLIRFLKYGYVSWDWRGPYTEYKVGKFIAQRRNERRLVSYRTLPEIELPRPEYEQNMRTLIGIAKANKVNVVLVTQQWLFSENMAQTVLDKFWAHGGDYLYPEGDMEKLLAKYNSVTRELAREFELPLVDLEQTLQKEPSYFYDEMHFSPAGAKKVAELVAPFLRDALIPVKAKRVALRTKQ